MKYRMATARPRRYTQRARAQAAGATAQRIVDAFLARLMTHWFDEITLDRVAADAGVTVQTVVRRFGGKEGLLADAVKTLASQINARRASPAGDIDRLVANVIDDYEQTGDAVIRLLALEPRHPALGAFIAFGRNQHRRWVSEVFAETLGRLDAAARSGARDALVIATDVYVWKLLRRDLGRSVAATTAIMKGLIHVLIAEFTNFKSKGDRQ
jgi:AcrR family transcriptional regulator